MFRKAEEGEFRTVLDKIRMKTLVYGDKTLMAEFRLEAGAELPRHSHPHEQTGYLVSGKMTLTIGDKSVQLRPGDSWAIHGNVEHSAVVLSDSVAVEVFSPVREEYLPET